jgi:hypothetical protein
LPTRTGVTRLARVKARALLAIVVAVVIAFAVYWLTRGRRDAEASSAKPPGVAASSGTSPAGDSAATLTGAPTPAHRGSGHGAAERAAMLEAIANARAHRTAAPAGVTHATGATAVDSTATTLDIVDKTGDTSDWEKRTLGTLNTLLGQCYDLGRAQDPTLAGTVALRFTVVGEPNVGGLLEHVEIVDANTSITQQTIRDCMSQQLYALELDPPPVGVTVERELHLKFR